MGPLSNSSILLMYFGDAVFAVSGALSAASRCVDSFGFIRVGTIIATGGGVIRDLVCGYQPMITSGQIYVTAALAGAPSFAAPVALSLPFVLAQVLGFTACFPLRSVAVIHDIRPGPPGSVIERGGARRMGKRGESEEAETAKERET